MTGMELTLVWNQSNVSPPLYLSIYCLFTLAACPKSSCTRLMTVTQAVQGLPLPPFGDANASHKHAML